MLKRLLVGSDVDKLFKESNVDKAHTFVQFRRLNDALPNYFTKDGKEGVSINISIANDMPNINISISNDIGHKKLSKKKEFIHALLKRIDSSSQILRIKGLIVAHYLIRKTYDSQLIEVLADKLDSFPVQSQTNMETFNETSQQGRTLTIAIDNQQQQFIQQHVISFYCQYLKKLLININTFRFAEAFVSGDRDDRKYPDDSGPTAMIDRGFMILNLCNYILQSQQIFNKMGRYYSEHNQIINLFLMYLNDLMVYNSYIKQVTSLSLRCGIDGVSSQQTKHYFLFVTEAQKTSDRFYEFFYNRYYYDRIKKMIILPTFLTIDNNDYKELVDYVKKIDRNLVSLVKKSKFQQRGRSMSLAARSKTQTNECSRAQSTQKTHRDLGRNISDYSKIALYLKTTDKRSQQFA